MKKKNHEGTARDGKVNSWPINRGKVKRMQPPKDSTRSVWMKETWTWGVQQGKKGGLKENEKWPPPPGNRILGSAE